MSNQRDAVMDQNAKHAGQQVKWNKTKIHECEFARTNDPFAQLARDTTERQTKQTVRRGSGSYAKGMGTTRNYGTDVDMGIIAEYLDFDMTCSEALTSLSQSLVMRQRDHSRMNYWVGLRSYLSDTMPFGSLIADCNPLVLARNLQQLAANVN